MSAYLTPETPHHVSEKIDEVLDRLNAKWNLRLPRLYGSNQTLVENGNSSDARKCSSRIRYLCYQPNIDIDKVLNDFEEGAQAVFSEWKYKPSQEGGTLPSRYAEHSWLKRDIMSGNTRPMTDALRTTLISKLASILNDEYDLARNSDSYQRTSMTETSDRLSRTTSLTTAPSEIATPQLPKQRLQETTAKLSAKPISALNKRRQTSGESSTGKRPRARPEDARSAASASSIKNYFKSSKASAIPAPSNTLKSFESSQSSMGQPKSNHGKNGQPKDVFTSFDTATTDVAEIFSDVEENSCVGSGNTSANTSLIFEEAPESQNYFPTQDAHEFLADESFASLLDPVETTPILPPFSFDDLDATTPFRDVEHLPSKLSFWLRWEIYRIAHHTGLSPAVFHNAIKQSSTTNQPTYNQIWNSWRGVCREKGTTLPGRSDIRIWMEDPKAHEPPKDKAPCFGFSLEYCQTAGPQLWKLVLNPIQVDKSQRIQRKYGAEQLVTGLINFFDPRSLPTWITKQKCFDVDKAFQKLFTWLALQTHKIAGRKWRAFYIEPDERKTKRPGDVARQKLSLFAIDGPDFAGVYELVNWHLSPHDNIHSTDLKLYSRLRLGLSKTIPTTILEPSQFRYLPDKEPVMNDGCALISTSLAKDVWAVCGDGSKNVPSAFQGRISGAKGLWVVDYRNSENSDDTQLKWIQVSDSQLKVKPHPRDRLDADETQRCFEVVQWSSVCLPGHLNIQLINVLADRKVPRKILRQCVLNDIQVYIDASKGAMTDPRLLLAWLQDYHTAYRGENPVSIEFGLPDSKEDSIALLVQSGFDAANCEFVRQGIIDLMTIRLKTYVDKLRVEIPNSTTLFCVPDPYGILDEDEVYLGFSTQWENPKTGLRETALDNIDVLVSRNPAHLASDIQKRKAVYKHELRHFKDVIVFSTKGDVPLASLLSGGDYDGDTVMVIWEPELVDPFCNVDKPDLPDEERCGLTKVSKKLTEIFKGTLPVEKEIDEFLKTSLMFNAQPSRLGICSNEHEKLIYSNIGMSDPGAIMLAALAGYLVDANKQGLSQSEAEWFHIRGLAQNKRKLPELAYKNGEDRPRRLPNGDCVNIIDYLKFDVAMKRKNEILVEFEKMLPNAWNFDMSLCEIFKREYSRSEFGSKDPQAEQVAALIRDLRINLKSAVDEWSKLTSKRETEPRNHDLDIVIQHISNLIQAIKPLQTDCDIYHEFIRDEKIRLDPKAGGRTTTKGSRWSLIRASAMYKWYYNRPKITWWVVGDELARIKARSLGLTGELTPAMHNFLKADTKLIKRITGDLAEIEDDEDVYE